MLSAARIVPFALLLAAILAGCVRDDPRLNSPSPDAPPELSVEIVSPAEGAQIDGNVVELRASAEGIEISQPDGDISGATGHFHVFIDQDPVASGETISEGPGIVHFSEPSVKIPGLATGRHRLTLVLGDGSETRIGRASDVVEVEVRGPAIDATAPEDAPLATGFTVITAVTGVQIGGSEGAAPGGARHLDLIIDPDEDPEANGQPMPADPSHVHTTGTTHQVTGLPAGEHTVWVVLTDENHVPVSPLVADKVVVTIR